MGRRSEPNQKKVKDILADIRQGYREAAVTGSASGLKYLRSNFRMRDNIPYAVRTVVHDLMAECHAQLGEWRECADSVALALQYLDDARSEFPHEFRGLLEGLTCFERGIQAHSELGEHSRALELCDAALAHGLGDHFAARKNSLEWAR